MVIATAALVDVARQSADLVVIDTTGTISGVVGETLKYHKVELTRPDTVVAIQRVPKWSRLLACCAVSSPQRLWPRPSTLRLFRPRQMSATQPASLISKPLSSHR